MEGNYHPVSLLPSLSKTRDRLVPKQITDFLSGTLILDPILVSGLAPQRKRTQVLPEEQPEGLALLYLA